MEYTEEKTEVSYTCAHALNRAPSDTYLFSIITYFSGFSLIYWYYLLLESFDSKNVVFTCIKWTVNTK